MADPARILVVDDSEDEFLLIERHLKENGFHAACLRVSSPEELSRALSGAPWDVVLCDVKLPVVRAFEVLKQFGRLEPAPPVIVTSGVASVEDLVELMRAGAKDMVRKVNLSRLIPVITREMREAGERRRGRAYKAQLHTAVENITEGLTMFDADGKLILCNSRYQEMYKLPEELTKPGTSLRDIFRNHTSDGKHLWPDPDATIRARLKWSEHPCPGTGTYELTDGRTIRISRQPLPSGGWVSTHDDITEQKKTQDELITHRDHLQELVDAATEDLSAKTRLLEVALKNEQELNRLKSEFVSMASHEFRTPLAIIDFTAQRVRRRAVDNRLTNADAVRWMNKIMAATRRMAQLMESTLSAARAERGVFVRPGPCDIKSLLRQVVSRQQEISARSVISCEMSEVPRTIQADSGALDQVFSNLLSNAVKYSPDGGTIRIAAYPCGSDVVIAIQDCGIGMDAEDIPKIFDRFFRARTATGIPGTGIGLALVKALVEKHDGTVSVASEKGNGSTFSVRLPVAGPTPSGDTPEPADGDDDREHRAA
jgi:signal transduction histidine kinase/DNA-binding response OmpR family regulator